MISLVIPVYNEKASLEELLRRVVAVDMPKELIVVDDCSTDGSREILARLAERGLDGLPDAQPRNENRLAVLFQERNQGKGAALRRGFAGRHRRRGRRAGRGSGIRPARDSPAGGAHPRRARRRGVRQPLHRRDAPGALLLARGGELGAHHALQHDLGPEPDGHGDLLQGLPPRAAPVHPHRGGPVRLRAGDHRQGGSRRRPGSTRCRSATTAGPTRKARRSAGRTGSARSMRSRSTR